LEGKVTKKTPPFLEDGFEFTGNFSAVFCFCFGEFFNGESGGENVDAL